MQFSTVKEGSLKHALTPDEDGKEAFPKPPVVEEMICQTSRDLKEVFEYDEAPEDVLQWAISQAEVLAMTGKMTPLTIRVTPEQKTEAQELNLSPRIDEVPPWMYSAPEKEVAMIHGTLDRVCTITPAVPGQKLSNWTPASC